MRAGRKKFFIRTFGCQMNKNDARIIAALLEQKDYVETGSPDKADILIVNTCSVRAHAEQRALG
ncbi:MAG: tRNA (N6-isopentenyl adenosine(37)-C2)-methylthiotransferase MiaB, partial [candidate division WOR-3 bacterium]